MKKRCADDQCRRAGRQLNLSQFWFNKAMKDGLDLYCSECRARRNTEYRIRQRSGKRLRAARKPMMLAEPKDPFTRVYNAIHNKGLRTREEIQRSTRLSYDVIGDALLELIFYCKVVRIVNCKLCPVESEAVRAA